MKPLIFDVSAAQGLAGRLIDLLGAQAGELDRRQFPDGESYVRLASDVEGRSVILLCTLDHPDPKLAPLLFAAATARDQGAAKVGLVAPYLAYMRQDRSFRPGEAVTSKEFARLLSGHFDWLVTVDPHLHRYPGLEAVYSIPAVAATATTAIGEWVRENVADPLIIGPDEESLQWVERIAALAGARSTVLRKTRGGDYSVNIDDTGLERLGRGTPVIVDDIASSARTMIEAISLLKQHISTPAVCAVVHPIFAGDSYARLLGSGAARVASTNSIAHESNAIDISEALATAVRSLLMPRA